MPLFTEKSTVEEYIIEKLKQLGWQRIPGDELEREDLSEPLIVPRLVRAIKRINGSLDLTESDINRVIAELKSRPSTFEGSKQILRFLKQGVPIKLERTKELRYIKLIDFDPLDPEKTAKANEFVVSDQLTFQGPKEKIRTDLVLFVNGIPLVVVECKNPTDPSLSWEDAYRQVKDYEKLAPELFKYVQFSIAAAVTARYFPNVLGGEEVKIYCWRKQREERGGKEPTGEDVLDSTIEMLSQQTLLDILINFVFAREERGRFSKVLPRRMQYQAVNRIFERVVNNLRGKEQRNSGLIWHWQGSGKTLAMIYATHKLYRYPALENPTIFLVVDRDELEEQLSDEFSYLDLGIAKPEVISSINHLREVLTHDECRGKRGVFITLIHKFQKDLAALTFAKEHEESISNRKNVIVIIDEGHRTQYGKLANQMRSILKNAFFFAFTGTPLAKGKRDTYRVFSYPDQGELYLHKYFIRDSMDDGFTIPIVFQTRMEKEVGLRKKMLQDFLKQDVLEEIPEDLRGIVEQRISRRLNDIIVFLENPKRIEKIARDIAEHFKENVDGKFKAMVVAASRKACVIYKEKLDELLPSEYSEVVMTFNPHTDPDPIKRYYGSLRARYQNKRIDEIKSEVVRRFKEEELPKILIVTDMLLTGFDAPVLQVMYLDKPLKEHRLLQAIARTNRPFGDFKEAGLIIDYVGILKEFEKALAIYEKRDVQYVGFSPEDKVREFKKLLAETGELFSEIDTSRADRETLRSAARLLFHDIKKQQLFTLKYRRLRRIYEFLPPNYFSPADIKRFKWLTEIHNFYRNWIERQEPEEADEYFRRYFRRTVETIHKAIRVEMKEEFPRLKIDKEYLEKLQERFPKLEEQVTDLASSLHRFVCVERARRPIFESIAKKVERLVVQWRDQRMKAKEAYNRMLEVYREAMGLEERMKKLDLPEPAYFLLTRFEEKFGRSKKLVEEVRELWKKWKTDGKIFDGWNRQPTVLKEIGRDIRRFLRKKKLSLRERDELYEEIVKGLRTM